MKLNLQILQHFETPVILILFLEMLYYVLFIDVK